MEEKSKREYRPENEAYKERFQILLEVNGNTICQRYFKVNDFIRNSTRTVEFNRTMEKIVDMIRADLERKSRIYQWYTANLPLQMTGFTEGFEGEPDYMTFKDEPANDKYDDCEELKPYDVTFKLSFLINEKPVYQRVWDGTEYPKYVRNSVDLLNYCPKFDDVTTLNFKQMLRYKMTNGEPDLTYKMIRMVYDTISGRGGEKEFTYVDVYRDTESRWEECKDTVSKGYWVTDKVKDEKNYSTVAYNRAYVDEWREITKSKTNDYLRSIGVFQGGQKSR